MVLRRLINTKDPSALVSLRQCEFPIAGRAGREGRTGLLLTSRPPAKRFRQARQHGEHGELYKVPATGNTAAVRSW